MFLRITMIKQLHLIPFSTVRPRLQGYHLQSKCRTLRESGQGELLNYSWDPATFISRLLFVFQMKKKTWFDVQNMTKDKNIPSSSLVKPEWYQYQRQHPNTLGIRSWPPAEQVSSLVTTPSNDPKVTSRSDLKELLMPPAKHGNTLEMGRLDFLHWLHWMKSHLTTGNTSFLGHRNLTCERARLTNIPSDWTDQCKDGMKCLTLSTLETACRHVNIYYYYYCAQRP